MMSGRHNKLGIKQTIQKKWMDRTVQMMLAGMCEKEIRLELDEYLSTQKQSGGTGERGEKTYKMAISVLAAWFAPEDENRSLRDDAINLARDMQSDDWLPLHWAVLSAAYPFWFNVARQAGRLLNLQERVTQAQIISRLKEQYGDRETVSRNARYTIRSFVAWGVLKDTYNKGCYEKPMPVNISDARLAILLIESALLTISESRSELRLLLNNPAFFPFRLPAMTGDFISQNSGRIGIFRHGLDDELCHLLRT